jgi:autotransporter-associated beta strand protein
LRGSASHTVLALAATALLTSGAWGDVDSGTTVTASSLSGSGTTLAGGTVQLDVAKVYSRGWTLKDATTSTIDAQGFASTLSGKITGSGNITFGDSKGGGTVTLSNSSNDYTGITTINSGVTLALIDSDTTSDTNTDSGTIQYSQRLVNNGKFDISGTVSGATIVSLSGTGNIVLGSNSLTLNDYDSQTSTTYDTNTTYSGVISGKGSLVLTSGEITLTGINTLTGAVTVSSDTLHLSGDGSISQSASVLVYGTLDAAAAKSVIFQSLTGSGTVALGANDLVLNAASGSFSGTITGTTGKLILNGGTEWLGGISSFSQVVINGGTLEAGATTVAYNVANNGTFSFYNSDALAMTGVISGIGAVTKLGSGIATISTVQTYTGTTTISGGTLLLSGAGSIASSSGVEVDSILDLTSSTNAVITSLTGIGTVRLGTQSLAISSGAGGDFSGTITGSGALTISGGTQSLSGTNTYTGATTVSGGTLVMVAGASLKSAVTVASGASFNIAAGVTDTGNATVTSLSGAGSVNLGGNTLVLSAAADTFAGSLAGTGNLWIGGGTETLSGLANIYTGTTTVAAGTLVLTGRLATASKLNISGTLDATRAADTTLTFVSLAGSGSVMLGGNALVLNTVSGTSTTFSGVISGTAGLTVSGAGTEALSGANTYTGGTAIGSGATLQIGNGSSFGSITGNVSDSGTLKFYRMDSSKLDGVISGTGDVVQAGIGTTVLTGVNTYTGTTTISAGTLQIGDGTISGSIASTSGIVDNGTLAFSSPGAAAINTAISGTGNLSILTGTVTLTSVNTYTGVTKIASGATLALTNTANINTSSSVTINGTLDLSGLTAGITLKSLAGSGAVDLGNQVLTLTSASTTFSGVVSSSNSGGGLILTSGTQGLSGINTYTGATLVNGGVLSVTGSIAKSAVTVNNSGTITGTGSVASLTVASGGTVKATNSGTLSATGAITFQSGSKYQVDLSSAGTVGTILTTTGTASVTGSVLTVTSSDGTYDLGNPITILHAGGGITGAFTSSQTFTSSANSAVFKSAVTENAANTDLYLTVNLYQITPAVSAISGVTLNQKHVGAGIDAALAAADKANTTNTTVPKGFETLGNDTTSVLSTAATELTGEIGADTPLAAKAAFEPFLDALSARTAMQRPLGKDQTQPLETWINAYGGTDIVTGDATGNGSHKFHASVAGVVAGAQWAPWSNVVLGGAISAGRSDFHIADDLGKGNATSVQAGVYGYVQNSRHFYTSFAAGAGLSSIKTTRVITVSGTDTLTGKVDAYTFGGRYEAGIQLSWFTPYIGVQDHVTMLPSYTESAATGSASTFALKYDSRTYNSGRVEVGLRHHLDVDVTPRWILTPDFTLHINDRLAWAHGLSDGSQSGAEFAALPSSNFNVFGAKAKRDGVLGSVGADVLFNNGLRLTANVDTAFTEKSQSFTGFAGVGYTW